MHRWLVLLLLALTVGLVFWWNRGDVIPPVPAPAPSDSGGLTGAGAAAADTRDTRDVAAREQTPHGEPEPAALAPTVAPTVVPQGLLVVTVVDEADGVRPGCTVTAGEETATTDPRGRAEFKLPALRLRVRAQPPEGEPLLPANGWQTVHAGATTEVRLVLAAMRTFAFCCRLVAEEDGRPLRGAQVSGLALPEPVASDADGLVQVLLGPSNDWLDVQLAGRAWRRIATEPGHEAPAQAMRVPLLAEATLALSIVDAAGAPVPGVDVTLSTHPWQVTWPGGSRSRGPNLAWPGTSDLRGALLLATLPPARSLDVAFEVPDGRGAIPPVQWSLVAGRNERTLTVQAPGVITGRVIDDHGRPVAGVKVCALPADDDSTPRDPAGLHGHVFGTSITLVGEDGAFRTGELTPGAWWLGLYADGTHVATVQRVEVRAGASTDVTLRVQPGLAVAGRALAPDGSAAAGVAIDLARDGSYCTSARTDSDGRFRFFPLPGGSCELTVDQYEGELGLPRPVAATVGDEAIELRLVPVYGTIAGRVTTGHAWVFAMRRGSDDAIGQGTDLDGTFRYPGLLAGTWDLHASDHAGNAAVLGEVQVLPGRETAGLQLALAPGGHLVLQHHAADAIRIERGAAVAQSDNLPAGTATEVALPPGPWTVVFLAHDAEIERRDVTLRAGERLRVGSK